MMLRRLNSAVEMYIRPAYKANRPVMALSFDKRKINGKYNGLIREIVKREGDVAIPGFLDRSQLYHISSTDGLIWERGNELNIRGIEKVVEKCNREEMFFIGLEDPDVWVDKDDVAHVYFTIAYKKNKGTGFLTYLGHATGKDLYSLQATMPLLTSDSEKVIGFKEVAISPEKYSFGRINLAESGYRRFGAYDGVSTVIAAVAEDMAKPWKYMKTVIDPASMKYKWIQGDASPGPIFPRDFVSLDNLLVMILNGREPKKLVNGKKMLGQFTVGLALFNPKTGDIPWISSKPLISDPDAKTITFASDFLMLNKNSGILYAHVDDSFVRAYKIDARKLIKYLPDSI